MFLEGLRAKVETEGACSLPGVSINFDMFVKILRRAVQRGFVARDKAAFVEHGLRFGFDLGVDTTMLKGRQRFRNYPTAIEARRFVTKATRARVLAGKTVCLGEFNWARDRGLLPESCRIFPVGAVPKPLEPDERRPISDHSRTQLNEATNLSFLRHTLMAYEEIAEHLNYGYSMRVSDVDAAFPLLPLAATIWPYFFFLWYDLEAPEPTAIEELDPLRRAEPMYLYLHLCGDFGAAGLPGTFKIFFSDCVIGMARSEDVITLPLVVYVDDLGSIGPDSAEVDQEGLDFGEWLKGLGIRLKELKEKAAATLQLMLGFWWNSLTRTRTLEERKFKQYTDMLFEFSTRHTLTLREMQQMAGRMQRAVMTLPPGAACFLHNLFALMRGLSVPWQRRRTSRALRSDFTALFDLLQANDGRGYFSLEHFRRAPEVDTDASKERRYAGGGYASRCGAYRWWIYGGNAARQPIDFLEGDTVVVAMEDNGCQWKRCVVPFNIDNSAFQRSAVKGWSRAERLTLLLHRVFDLSVRYEFIGEFRWLSTHHNVYADALSRQGGEERFLRLVEETEFLRTGAVLRRHPQSGHIRRFGRAYSSDEDGDGPPNPITWIEAPCCPGARIIQCLRCFGTYCPCCGLAVRACYDLHGCRCDQRVELLAREDAREQGDMAFDWYGAPVPCGAPNAEEAGFTLPGMTLADEDVDDAGPSENGCDARWRERLARTHADEEFDQRRPGTWRPPCCGRFGARGTFCHSCDGVKCARCTRPFTRNDDIDECKGEECDACSPELWLEADEDLYDADQDPAVDVDVDVEQGVDGVPPVDDTADEAATNSDWSSEEEVQVDLPEVWQPGVVAPFFMIAPFWAIFGDSDDTSEDTDEETEEGIDLPEWGDELDHRFEDDNDGGGPRALRLRGAGPARGVGSLLDLTVPYTRASVYYGLDDEAASWADEVLDNRLSSSAMRSINSALAHWDAARARYGWPRVIASDDPRRGAKLLCFVMRLVRDTELVASSIANYTWALRSWLQLQRQLDPVFGIVEWQRFMDGVAVLTHVASEPRKAIPIKLLRAAIGAVNHHIFWEVQCVHLILVLLFTFARSETPLPKAYTGEDSFDPFKNLMVCDVRVAAATLRLYAHLEVRMKAQKADPRMERPEAAGNNDWILIGEAEDELFSMLRWTQELFAWHGERRPGDAPFYVDRDRRRPYLYGKAIADMRELFARATTKEEAYSYGLHGLRVTGYDLSRRYNPELAVAQGGWKSSAHERYDRFPLTEVLALPGVIVAAGGDDSTPPQIEHVFEEQDSPAPPPPLPPPTERTLLRTREAGRIGSTRRRGNGDAPVPARSSAPRRAPRVQPLLLRDSGSESPPTPPPNLSPLTGFSRDVGRRVMVPASLWPDWPCEEFAGRGWLAIIERSLRSRATVRFLVAHDDAGRPFVEHLSTEVLCPV